MKIVLDPKVIIAAFASRGLCDAILELCLDGHEIILSEELMEEIIETLVLKLRLPGGVITRIEELLGENSVLFRPVTDQQGVNIAENGQALPVLAAEARADCIITGDGDLKGLTACSSIPVVTPRTFTARYLCGITND